MQMTVTAKDVLNTVGDILGAREANYNNPTDNFQVIADGWTWYLKSRYAIDLVLNPDDIAFMMILTKIARENYKHTDDNILDTIGYGVCAAVMLIDKLPEKKAA
jgi:hypothetical protein